MRIPGSRYSPRRDASVRSGVLPDVVAFLVMVFATPVAVWWAVGDWSIDATEPDYAVRPLALSGAAQTTAGVAASLLTAVAAVVLWRRGALRRDRRWFGVLFALLVIGVLAAMGWRIVTAGVIGANIGAGFVIIFGVPLAAVVIVWAVARSIWLATRGRRSNPRATSGEIGSQIPAS